MSRVLGRRLDIMEFQPEKVLYECFFDFGEVGRVLFSTFSTRVQLPGGGGGGNCTSVENVEKAQDQPCKSQKNTSKESFLC